MSPQGLYYGSKLDPACGVPEAVAARKAMARGDWRSIEAEHSRSIDWPTRALIVRAASHFELVPEWTATCPESSLAHLVRSAQLVRMAWDVRGADKAATVPKSHWPTFLELLREAEKALWTAVKLEPADPEPWSRLIKTGMGLQIHKDEVLSRFSAATQRDPHYVGAWLAIVPAVAAKWSGSHSLMFDVARQANRLPEGSPARVAIAVAHDERRLYLVGWEDNERGAAEYFGQPDVAAEAGLAATESVLSPAHLHSGWTRIAQSWFAYALAHIGATVPTERLRAAALFVELGTDGLPDDPWMTRYWYGGEEYERARATCYRAAGIALPATMHHT